MLTEAARLHSRRVLLQERWENKKKKYKKAVVSVCECLWKKVLWYLLIAAIHTTINKRAWLCYTQIDVGDAGRRWRILAVQPFSFLHSELRLPYAGRLEYVCMVVVLTVLHCGWVSRYSEGQPFFLMGTYSLLAGSWLEVFPIRCSSRLDWVNCRQWNIPSLMSLTKIVCSESYLSR